MAYDVMVDGRWLNYGEFRSWCDGRNIPRVPELYVGPYSSNILLECRDGDSTVGGQKVREGCVVKPVIEQTCHAGRKVLKAVSDQYLLGDQTDFH